MPVVGFNFTKLSAERGRITRGKISINNNIGIIDVKEATPLVGGKQKGVIFVISFETEYKPNIGKIGLEGEALFIGKAEKVDEIMNEWKKNKKIPSDIAKGVIAFSLNKCNVEALLLSKELGLPAPIPLPRIDVKEVKKK